MAVKLEGQKLGGRYKILSRVGGGGMATVYRAKDTFLNRFVAIKVLNEALSSDTEFVRRFSREAQAAASLSHPNIVSVYDVGCEDYLHYIVMELVEGPTLKEYIVDRAPLEREQFAEITTQICDALLHAHENKIIHRDIKPHNILLGFNGRVKVTDFGIARAANSATITQTGSIMGSVHYFSPEQARGGSIDEKSDIYSLGIIMYEMLTGQLPFIGDSAISIALKHLQDVPIDVREINPDVNEDLAVIVNKALEKDPDKRYIVAQDLRQTIRGIIKSEPDAIVAWGDFKSQTAVAVEDIHVMSVVNNKVKKKYRIADMSFPMKTKQLDDTSFISRIKARFSKVSMEGDGQQTILQRTLTMMSDKKIPWWQRLLFIFFTTGLIATLVVVGFTAIWSWLSSHGGSDKVRVEKFQTVSEAREWLEKKKFTNKSPEIIPIPGNAHSRDEVIKQEPPVGTEIDRKNASLKLYVGQGGLQVKDYRGMYESKIITEKQEAAQQGYKIRVVHANNEESDGVAEYKVYKQEQTAGTPINPGDVITVYVKISSIPRGATSVAKYNQ